MLEFIVLGLVPGTNFQLGFKEVLLGSALLGIGAILELELVHFFKSHRLLPVSTRSNHTASD
ncbi:MAG TPA: hypothetical protein VLE74_01355 [Candidatus Saccharimonadales bacterium]|nr:hypothetical protein [Candidatus Saccharimonadales bacterium]